MSSKTLHVNPPFRAEHLGSLIRPSTLTEKRELFADNKLTKEELTACEDESILAAVALQHECGMKSLTDGEFRRTIFMEGVMDKLNGVELRPFRPWSEWRVNTGNVEIKIAKGIKGEPSFYCNGPISRAESIYKSQFLALKSVVPAEEVKNIKQTVCTPSWFHRRHGTKHTYSHDVYKSDDEYFDALGAAYREEFKELYDLGCRNIQIDDPLFCYGCDEGIRQRSVAEGIDPEEELKTYIRAINVCTQDRPSDLTISLHMCRGNWPTGAGGYMNGSYDWVADKIFPNLDVDALYLEFDSERCGDFTPLAHVPPHMIVVLGLVTTKNPKIEPKEDLKARIDEAAEAMTRSHNRTKEQALNQLCISPQCGFSSIAAKYPLTEDDERAKLKLLVETAKEVWSDAQ